MLTGISNGEGQPTTNLTFTNSNPALITSLSIGDITNGAAQLTYTLGAGTGSSTINVIANYTANDSDIPDTATFAIHVVSADPTSTTVTIDAATEYQEYRGIGGVLSDDDLEVMSNSINDLNWTMMRVFGDFYYI